MQPACVRCNQADRVEKVSAIFGNSVAYPTLAPRLKPPAQPAPPPTKFTLSSNEVGLIFIVGFFTVGLGWVVLPLLFWQRWRNWQMQYPRAHAAWQTEMHRWAQRYYCARCDVAFTPPALPAHSLPPTCPQCSGALRSDEVRWIDTTSAACPWCGSSVKTLDR